MIRGIAEKLLEVEVICCEVGVMVASSHLIGLLLGTEIAECTKKGLEFRLVSMVTTLV